MRKQYKFHGSDKDIWSGNYAKGREIMTLKNFIHSYEEIINMFKIFFNDGMR